MRKRLMAALAAVTLASGCAVREMERETGPKAASTETYETVKVMKVDPAARPIRDIRKSSCCPIVGYAGSMLGEPDAKYWYEQNREGLAKAFRACGARFVRLWNAIRFWKTGAGARLVGKVGDAKRLAQARELLRFSEDQFVVWRRPSRRSSSWTPRTSRISNANGI